MIMARLIATRIPAPDLTAWTGIPDKSGKTVTFCTFFTLRKDSEESDSGTFVTFLTFRHIPGILKHGTRRS